MKLGVQYHTLVNHAIEIRLYKNFCATGYIIEQLVKKDYSKLLFTKRLTTTKGTISGRLLNFGQIDLFLHGICNGFGCFRRVF